MNEELKPIIEIVEQPYIVYNGKTLHDIEKEELNETIRLLRLEIALLHNKLNKKPFLKRLFNKWLKF